MTIERMCDKGGIISTVLKIVKKYNWKVTLCRYSTIRFKDGFHSVLKKCDHQWNSHLEICLSDSLAGHLQTSGSWSLLTPLNESPPVSPVPTVSCWRCRPWQLFAVTGYFPCLRNGWQTLERPHLIQSLKKNTNLR